MTGFITSHFYTSGMTLGDIDNHDAFVGCFPDKFQKPFGLRSVTATEGFHDDTF